MMPPRFQLFSGRFTSQLSAFRLSKPSSRCYADVADPADALTPVVKNPLKRRKGGDPGSHLPRDIIPKDAYIPPYPHGDQQLFKQANKGLYGEQIIQFGNNVSAKTKTKTRRQWFPNVLPKSLYSITLKKKIKLRITARVLKTIDREGGLDEYLLKDSENRIRELGPLGWALRWTLMQNPAVTSRLRLNAAALGIDQATIDKQWPTAEMMAEHKKSQAREAKTSVLDLAAFPKTEGQELFDPTEIEDPPVPISLDEKIVVRDAVCEYESITRASQRYLERGVVDSEEEGIKLAFVRVKERREAAAHRKQAFEDRLAAYSDEELEEVRTRFNIGEIPERVLRRIVHNQRRRKEIDEAGSVEAWNQAKQDAYRAKRGFEPVDSAAYAAQKKAEYSALLQEAETAAINDELSPERREHLVAAIKRADRLLNARASGGKAAYIEAMVEEHYSKKMPAKTEPSGLTGETSTDASTAVVDANK